MTKFLSVNQVVEINRQVIIRINPKEQIGVKDYSLLDSAVNRPLQSVLGEDAYKTIWSKASALFESIGKNHAFHNGNKRTAFTAMVIFLYINNIRFKMNPKEAEDFTVDMVNGVYSFEKIWEKIRLNCE